MLPSIEQVALSINIISVISVCSVCVAFREDTYQSNELLNSSFSYNAMFLHIYVTSTSKRAYRRFPTCRKVYPEPLLQWPPRLMRGIYELYLICGPLISITRPRVSEQQDIFTATSLQPQLTLLFKKIFFFWKSFHGCTILIRYCVSYFLLNMYLCWVLNPFTLVTCPYIDETFTGLCHSTREGNGTLHLLTMTR